MSEMAVKADLHFTAERLRQQIKLVLGAWDMSADRARLTARLMVATDLLGIDSHGIPMLPDRLKKQLSAVARRADIDFLLDEADAPGAGT